MLLSQFASDGRAQIVARDGTEAYAVATEASLYDLALDCIARGESLKDRIAAIGLGPAVDLAALYDAGRLLPPIAHPDPAHLHLTGTGLTHLGSAETRDSMHAGAQDVTDSMKMFRMGLEGGRPANGRPGVQPEWFYKGTGHALVAPGQPLVSPGFAGDAGEEPEIAGIYIIDPEGMPVRVGFALANEFSDHVTERGNYLWLAHSKLRPAAIGPEILIGDLPAHIEGTSRIRRGNRILFEKPFLSGEANMSHSVANLEHHHFKYGLFCQPGDLHIHMFGTATLSCAEGVRADTGDVFEIEAAPFGLPLRNPLTQAPASPGMVTVRSL